MHVSTVPASAGSVFSAINPQVQPDSCRTDASVIDPATFGVVEIENSSWIPRKRDSAPPSCTSGMGTAISMTLARAYNVSEHAVLHNRWMLVTMAGECLILAGITERPSDPAAFPKCVRTGLRKSEAMQIRDEENEQRHLLARVPRSWTIAVRPMVSLADHPTEAPAKPMEFVDVWMVGRSTYLTPSEMMSAAGGLARLRNAPVDVKRVEIPVATFRHVATIMPTEAPAADPFPRST